MNDVEQEIKLCRECQTPVVVEKQSHPPCLPPGFMFFQLTQVPLCKNCTIMVQVDVYRTSRLPPVPWKQPKWRPSPHELLIASEQHKAIDAAERERALAEREKSTNDTD